MTTMTEDKVLQVRAVLSEADVRRIAKEVLSSSFDDGGFAYQVLGRVMKAVRSRINEENARLESQFAITLADTLAATNAVRKQAGTSADVVEQIEKLEKAMTKLGEEVREKSASFDRRISRHADNLAKLNDERRR